MLYEDVINLWGRNLLQAKGFNIDEDDPVYVKTGYQEYGSCETCSYTESFIEISSTFGKKVTVEGYDLPRILNELVALSVKEAANITENG